MSRIIIVGVVTFAVGIGAGVFGVHTLASDGGRDRDAVAANSGMDDARVTALQERLDQARAENDALQKKLDAMETDLPPTDDATEESGVDLSRVLGALAPDDKNVGEHLAEEAMEAAREQQREEWRARRAEWSQDFRGGMENFLDTAYADAKTPEEQERIAALGEYGAAMFELRQQMGDATTDEEREALGQAMRENFDGMRSLMQEQQDAMFRETLENAGIDKPGRQKQLIQELRETMDSPFFMGSPGGGGGGFRGPGGGGFGGGGRGGDRGGRGGR